ncbi:ribonuclease P protein component [Candidatus Cytomitobacter primus]|uniref:Ribonuclease P protein component n=1 Tax=Candidatus Cytomitobacter primus TaxID=2066024 RepID=A0A5C0UI80_9PROT|nr:ribonuclease P protein component [Candidatus Cytomitobacter primus]QEK38654.1 ribonuclease P protein component [Candidatus Cytomitobacter primus]
MRKYVALSCRYIFQKAKKEKPFFSKFFSIRSIDNNEDKIRIGIIANKKLGNAVVRNKCKRRIKNAIDRILCEHHSVIAKDIVIVLKREVFDCCFIDLLSSLQLSLNKSAF